MNSRRLIAASEAQDRGSYRIKLADWKGYKCPARVKLRSPDVQPAGRLYPQLRTRPCTAQTDALCQKRSFTAVGRPFAVHPCILKYLLAGGKALALQL